MGKSTAMWGKTSGKVGGLVYSTSGGETIVREYNPNVSNPNTVNQVNQRARMKLMSQLSAALAPVIAMTKEGLVSKRNKFTKKNFENSYAVGGVAQVSYENIQLTEGNTGLPQIAVASAIGTGGNNISMYFETEPSASISRVVYCLFSKTDEGKLNYVNSTIVEQRQTQGASVFFAGSIPAPAGVEYVVYAYGMSDTSEKASARYGNLGVTNGTDIATLVANRTISFEDYSFTQTRGATLGADGEPVEPTPAGSVRVFATATAGGTATGGGTYQVGAQVTLTATPNSGYEFSRWIVNGSQQTYSTTNPLVIASIQNNLDLVAVFSDNSGGGGL